MMNGWQRIWVVITVISLVIVFVVMFVALPKESQNVIRSIGMPECSDLLKIPEGYKLEKMPDFNSPCFDLAYIKYTETAKISSVEDYRSFVTRQNAYFFMAALGSWLGFVVIIYVLGWSVAWIVRGFKSTP